MASTTKFRINGLVDTSKNVLENINNLAGAGGSYLTWDPANGKWIVILNTTGTSSKSFDDTNIIGDISVSGSGLDEFYNSVSVTFPNKNTRDTTDVITIDIASGDRYANEIDNTLELSLPIVNDPIQAQYIASRELKQSRLDLIIEFRSNFEANAVKAGDLIDVTNAALDFTNKVFRVIQVDEEDAEDGNVIYSITAHEYNADVYDANLTYEYRSNFTGIKSKVFNAEIEQNDEADFGGTMAKLLGANALLGIISGILKRYVTADPDTGVITESLEFNDADLQTLMEAGAKKPTLTHTPTDLTLCPGVSETLNLSHDCSVCYLNDPNYTYDYTISGISAGEINIPLTGTVTMNGNTGSLTFIQTVTADTSFTVTVGGTTTTYDARPAPSEYIDDVVASASTITEGDSVTITVTTVGKANGSTLNYSITGQTASVSTPLSGSVTVNSNTASLTINTFDDSAYNNDETVIVTFTPQAINYCAVINDTVSITVLNNDVTGPQPPADTNCVYVQVPIVWCGVYDGTDGQLKSVEVRRSAYLPVAQAGEATVNVPATISVTKGNPSTITITSTVAVADNSNAMGGIPYQVITSFNTVAPNGLITGSTTAVYGYDPIL